MRERKGVGKTNSKIRDAGDNPQVLYLFSEVLHNALCP